MEYFLIKSLGYDGIIVTKYSDLPSASAAVKDELRQQEEWDKKYPEGPSDKGLVVIRGEVVISDHEEEILG